MQTLTEFLKNISVEQYTSLFIGLFLVGVARDIAQRALSVLFTVLGVLLAIYFIYPDGYAYIAREFTEAFEFLKDGGAENLKNVVANS